MARHVRSIPAVLLAAGLVLAVTGCRPANRAPVPTAAPTVEAISYGPLAARVLVTPGSVLWVDLSGEHVFSAEQIAESHRMALRGNDVEFTKSPPPAVSGDGSKALVGVRGADGRAGVLLIRSDGTSMAMYRLADRSASFGSVGFAPSVGMTLFGVSDALGSRVVAINNYARMQFELPVQDHRGEVLVAPDLSHIALARRGEVELASLETPGETVVIREGDMSADGRDLYREALRIVAGW